MDNQQVSYQDNKYYIIPIEPQFCITTEGKVQNMKTNNILKSFTDKDGYLRVTLSRGGKAQKYYVHRLVALTFLEPSKIPERNQVNHINSIRDDNHYSNLEWVTTKENTHHGMIHGFINNEGENSARSILTNIDVENICKLLEQGLSVAKITELSGFKRATIFSIKSGQTWKHISKNFNIPEIKSRMSRNDVLKVCENIVLGKSNKEILENMSHLNNAHVENIRNRKTFKNISDNFSW